MCGQVMIHPLRKRENLVNKSLQHWFCRHWNLFINCIYLLQVTVVVVVSKPYMQLKVFSYLWLDMNNDHEMLSNF